MTRKRQKKRRDKLFDGWPFCHYCGCKLTREKNKPNTLTLDHVYSKLNPKRHDPDYVNVTVLSCYQCNQDRARNDQIQFAAKRQNEST